MPDSLDAYRSDQSRPGDHVLSDRLAACRPSEHRLVDQLWARQPEQGLAGLRGVDLFWHWASRRSASIRSFMGIGLFAFPASGGQVPKQRGRCFVFVQSAWDGRPASAKDTRSTRQAQPSALRRSGRSRDTDPNQPIRNGLSHAKQRAGSIECCRRTSACVGQIWAGC